MAISQDTLRSALEQFRGSGDYAKLLHTLSGGKKEANDLLLLQHALQTTDDPDLRDMIDDAAWARANKRPLPRRPSEESLNRIVDGAVRAYGPLIAEVLPDLRELAGAIMTQTRTPAPPNAVIAAIGLHAQQEAEPLDVFKRNFGEETRYFTTSCDTCGGSDRGGGYIVCPQCARRARRGLGEKLLREKIQDDINELPAQQRLRLDAAAIIARYVADVATYVNLDELPQSMVVDFMKENPRRYGCAECNHRPVSDCRCARIVQVPDNCPDGWIVKGIRPATGEQFYAVLRVRE